jgi:hypothetical protein
MSFLSRGTIEAAAVPCDAAANRRRSTRVRPTICATFARAVPVVKNSRYAGDAVLTATWRRSVSMLPSRQHRRPTKRAPVNRVPRVFTLCGRDVQSDLFFPPDPLARPALAAARACGVHAVSRDA